MQRVLALGCAVEPQPVDLFDQLLTGPLFETGDMGRVPAEFALLTQNIACTEGIPTVQRDAVVKDMQDAHARFSLQAKDRSSSRVAP